MNSIKMERKERNLHEENLVNYTRIKFDHFKEEEMTLIPKEEFSKKIDNSKNSWNGLIGVVGLSEKLKMSQSYYIKRTYLL